MKKCLLVLAVATALTVSCRNDDRRTANTTGRDAGAVGTAGTADIDVARADRDFVHDAAIANMAEVELGRLTADKAIDAEVKKFGRMMVDDHTAAGERMKTIADEFHIEWPQQLDDKHRDLREKLAGKQGAEFDREYITAMVEGHENFVNKLESRVDKDTVAEWKAEMADRAAGRKAEERGKVVKILPEKSDRPVTMRINEWAAATYPVAQAHLEAAKTLDAALKRRQTNP